MRDNRRTVKMRTGLSDITLVLYTRQRVFYGLKFESKRRGVVENMTVVVDVMRHDSGTATR